MMLPLIYSACVVAMAVGVVVALSAAVSGYLMLSLRAPAFLWNLKKTAKARTLLVFYGLGSFLVGAISCWSSLAPACVAKDRKNANPGDWLAAWLQLPWAWWLVPFEVGVLTVMGGLLVMAIRVDKKRVDGRGSRLSLYTIGRWWFWQAVVMGVLFVGVGNVVLRPALDAGWDPASERMAWYAAACIPGSIVVAGIVATIAISVMWLARRLNVGTDLTEDAEKLPGVPQVVRGRAFWPLHAMRAAMERYITADRVSYGDVRVQFGGLTIPEKMLGKHSVFCGTTGAGKTISMQMFLATALFQNKSLRQRVITHDVKGDQRTFFRHCGVPEEDIVLCDPGSSRGWAWDMAADVRDGEGAKQLAVMLCPTEERSTNPYFSDVPQECLTEVLKAFQKVAPRAWTLRDVVLTCRNQDLLREVLHLTESGRTAWRSHVETNAASTSGGVLSTLSNKLGQLSYTAARWSEAKSRFSLREFLRGDPKVLLLRNRANRSEVSTPAFRALLRFMSDDILSMPEKHEFGETWCVLDELPSLGMFEKLDTFMSLGRTKGARVMVGFQDIDGLYAEWGRERAHVVLGLCTNVCCLMTASPGTASYWSKLFGSYTFPSVSVTETYGGHPSKSWTTANKTEEAMMESEIMGLPLASMERGIVGAYLNAMVGMWRGETSPEVMRQLLPPLDKDEADELEEKQVELQPWNADDRARLGLQLRVHPEEDRPRGIPGKGNDLEATG